jgi:hypothetical protein
MDLRNAPGRYDPSDDNSPVPRANIINMSVWGILKASSASKHGNEFAVLFYLNIS